MVVSPVSTFKNELHNINAKNNDTKTINRRTTHYSSSPNSPERKSENLFRVNSPLRSGTN